MKREEAIEKGLALANRSNIAMLGTIGAEGHPNVRAMIKMENFDKWMGLMLVGSIAILQDLESRKRCWREGFEKYYPKGVDEPDYSVLRFTTHWGQYYHGLTITNFDL